MIDLLTLILLLPLAGAVVISLMPRSLAVFSRRLGIAFALLAAVLGICLLVHFDSRMAGPQMVVKIPWLAGWGIFFHIAIDGMNLWLVLMTLWLTPLLMMASPSIDENTDSGSRRMTTAMLLVIETGALGTFLAQDLFLFYIFWELILIPSYLWIGMHGQGDRIKVAAQFFIYTFAGSLLMLLSILGLLWQYKGQTGHVSADVTDLMQLKLAFNGFCSMQGLMFAGMAAGFLVKAPLVPLHGWLSATYRYAPMTLTIYLAAILSKMGTYGVAKFLLPLFPEAAMAFAPCLQWLAAVGVVYGALVAFNQTDVKLLIAYASLSHVSGILLGLFSLNVTGYTGAVFQMLSHGVVIFGLFLCLGLLRHRRDSYELSELGGLAKSYPYLAIAFFIMTLGAVALPGTNGFPGEFLIILGSFAANKWPAIITATSMVLAAAYMLKVYQGTMFGQLKGVGEGKGDLTVLESTICGILIVIVLGFGIFPNLMLQSAAKSVELTVSDIARRNPGAAAKFSCH